MKKKEEEENGKIRLENVRLSFPSLFKKSKYKNDANSVAKYEATFLIDKKDLETKKKLDKAFDSLMSEAKIKIPMHKTCLKDGDEVEYEGYAKKWSLKASNNIRPIVIDRNLEPIDEDDEKIFAGCYVNAIVSLWLQNNKSGKRINANLLAVQFRKNGERFGFGAIEIDASSEFEDLTDLADSEEDLEYDL